MKRKVKCIETGVTIIILLFYIEGERPQKTKQNQNLHFFFCLNGMHVCLVKIAFILIETPLMESHSRLPNKIHMKIRCFD